MSAASTRWLRSALRVPEAPARFRGFPILRPRFSIYEGRQAAPVWLRVATPRHRRPYSISAPESPEQQPSEQQSLAPVSESQPVEPPLEDTLPADDADPLEPALRNLSLQCPGCGAFSQFSNNTIAGYYDADRKAVKDYMRPPKSRGLDAQAKAENDVMRELLKTMSPKEIEKLGLGKGMIAEEAPQEAIPPPKVPLCDRCHDIIHHHKGVSIYHPTVESLRRTISESPYNDNHIYHIIDAADFPMSLVPRLNDVLGGVALRTRNRRARQDRYLHGQKVEMSFVITRSDLLAPKKEQVDGLLAYLRETLRRALGRTGQDVRLGNVFLVSAKRTWWAKELKDRIWDKGGAAWMVGKVNVGKSQLFEAVFPKGKVGDQPPKSPVTIDMYERKGLDESTPNSDEQPTEAAPEVEEDIDAEDLDFASLLPPAQKLTNFPDMPTVSALPGTTASPIRIPFGNNKGELIDLPGLARGDLELYVKEEHRPDLVMKSRIVPVQQTIKPGQSLVLGGGLIRITPLTPGLVFLAYSFTPMATHVTRTEKAIGLQDQTLPSGVKKIMTEEGAATIKSAGTFRLRDDVTRSRSGPITRNDFMAIRVKDLPWRVLALDILIEGVGWVEVVAQVRTKDLFKPNPAVEALPPANPNDPWDGLLERDMQPKKSPPIVRGGKGANVEKEERWERNARREQNERRQQERKRQRAEEKEAARTEVAQEENLNWPEVEVFSPQGRFVGTRRCMNGWLLNKPLVLAKHKKARPRKSMKGQKKMARARVRAARDAQLAALSAPR